MRSQPAGRGGASLFEASFSRRSPAAPRSSERERRVVLVLDGRALGKGSDGDASASNRDANVDAMGA